MTMVGADSVRRARSPATLRNAGIRADPYPGNPKGWHRPAAQRCRQTRRAVRGDPGSRRKSEGEVDIRDLIAGSAPSDITDRDEYLKKQAEARSR